jgi:2-keto-4-pentenoate hydratase/2-oxohepta-3-ene-1,7-dioic acid hydratase in catechol pathway
MKICRFNSDRYGVLEGDRVLDVTEIFCEFSRRKWPALEQGWGDPFIAFLGQADLGNLLVGATPVALPDVRLMSPVARPSKVIGAPANYLLHIDESIADADIAKSGPIRPINELGLFLKASSSLVGVDEGITTRFPDRRTDHELEFVIVIGSECANVAEAEALDYVAGYSLGLDVTLRGSEERSFRKSIDSYTVLGPCLVTKDEIPNPDAVRFTLDVNDVRRQDAFTADMIFGCRKLISLASSFYTLHPGDLIYTGAPAGVGQIQPGDRLFINCEEIGSASVSVKGVSQ